MGLRSRHRRYRVQRQSQTGTPVASGTPADAAPRNGACTEQHKLLLRQLKKLGLDPQQPPPDAASWQQFLSRVNKAYQEADQDRGLLERSMETAMGEMQGLYENLQQASETRLASERDKLRAVISAVGAGLCTLDGEGRVLSINPEGCRLLRCDEDELLDGCFFDRVEGSWTHTDPAGCRDTRIGTLMQGGEPYRQPNGTFARKDGTSLPVSYIVNPVLDGDALQGAVLIFFDLTERKQAEQALRESEGRYRSLLEHLPVGVYRTTPEGRFIEANAATARLFGVEGAAALHRFNVREFYVDPAQREQHRKQLDDQADTIAEFQLQRPGGEIIWVRDYPQALRDDSDEVMFYDGILLDITEPKRAKRALQESEERYRTLVEHAAEAIVVLDLESQRFIDCNSNAEALYGLSREALCQTGPIAMSPALQPDGRRSAEVAREEIMRAVEGEVRVFEWVHCDAEGREIPCEVRLVRLPSDERVLIRGSITDITERKQAEQTLVKAREKAEEMSRMKSTFLNNMSHEIRTPLTAIIGFSAILAEEASPLHKELVELIELSGKRLLNTLNAVLDLSMLEAGGLVIENEWFDLIEVGQEKVAGMKPLAWEKNIELDLDTAAVRMPIYLDRACLDRILTHLIDNAIKFTAQGSVAVACIRDDEQVRICIKDTGVGIDEAFQPHLFDEFKQESTGLDRAHEGVGLGLAVTRRMVTLMGGTITVESQKEQGSTFEVTFPQPALTNGRAAEADDETDDRPTPCILVVEDTPEIEMLVEFMLSDSYDVITTPHEEGALALARQQRFDLVLMDINLGGVRTGVDAMEALRLVSGYDTVPIVAMTAYALLEDRTRFLEVGFDGYLSKPFSEQQAIDTIEQLLAAKP